MTLKVLILTLKIFPNAENLRMFHAYSEDAKDFRILKMCSITNSSFLSLGAWIYVKQKRPHKVCNCCLVWHLRFFFNWPDIIHCRWTIEHMVFVDLTGKKNKQLKQKNNIPITTLSQETSNCNRDSLQLTAFSLDASMTYRQEGWFPVCWISTQHIQCKV